MARHAQVKALAGYLSFATSSPFAKLLDGCGLSMSARDACRIHARIIRTQFSAEVFIQNRLIDVYGRCGCLGDTGRMFDRRPEKNTFTRNAILGGLIRLGSLDEAEKIFGSTPEPDQCFMKDSKKPWRCFGKMHRENYVLNEYSFGSALSACAGLGDMDLGQRIQALMLKSECSSDVRMGSALIDMYSKYGNMAFSWNSLITCYERNGPASEALEVFVSMMDCGFEIDEVALVRVVSACTGLLALKEGMQIHAHVVKGDKFRNDVVLGNALVDMDSKCSRISKARAVFDRMPTRDIVSATSVVSGYAKAASLKTARVMFTRMMEKNVVSWNALIAGYTQNGENQEGRHYFKRMVEEYGLAPVKDHYTCMVDLLDRSGCQSEVKDLIETMPMQADAVVWGSLLAACKVHKDTMLGKHVAEKLLEIDPSNSGPYVLLSNMYAESKKWGDVVRIRKLMRQRGVVKQPGCSWIEIQGQVHVFIVKDKRPPHKDWYVAITDDYEAHEELSELDFMSSEMEMLADATVC
ncbi:hypothetical protein ACJRO7_033558 [Eucalyptus globulus]|uniref:Pentatricopeptide repeat-containing protein n=1 Tax=Eucalyptus globulus TaxID=34317 RepID=A0ABD3JNG0_EUCGL